MDTVVHAERSKRSALVQDAVQHTHNNKHESRRTAHQSTAALTHTYYKPVGRAHVEVHAHHTFAALRELLRYRIFLAAL